MAFRQLLSVIFLLSTFMLSTTGSRSRTTDTKTCGFENSCKTNEDCGDKGRCVNGHSSDIYICACTQFRPCSKDSDCGSLIGACDLRQKYCDCAGAYRAHGLGSILEVHREFCSKKVCKDRNDCFGFNCVTPGFCVCSPDLDAASFLKSYRARWNRKIAESLNQ